MEKKSFINIVKNLSTQKKICYIVLPLVVTVILIITIVINTLYNKDIQTVANAKNDNTSKINNETQENSVNFPNGLDSIVGMTKEKATEELEKVGLKVKIEENTEYSDTILKDCVIKWTGVRYTGNWHYKYEDLNDLEIAAIKDSLKDYPKLLQEQLYEQVYEYEKLTDSNLIEGDTITLIISKGKEIKVPELLGMTEQKAKEVINNSNLKYKETLTGSNLDYEENTIIEQSIVAGTMVAEDTEISITINKQVRREMLSINVKSMNNSNKETVKLLVKANGQEIFNELVDSSSKNQIVNIESGNIVNIEIYIENSLKYSKEIDLRKKTSSNAPIYISNENTDIKTNNNKSDDYVLDIY